MSIVIETKDLSYRYPNRPNVLEAVSFTLEDSERVALTGSNGAGKTTFLHLLVGLTKAKSGEIRAFEKNLQDESDFQNVRTQVGMLFQDPEDQLFCPTVIEDVAFGPLNLGANKEEARTIADQTLCELGLAGFGPRITHQLSGGEKRLVALASVLAMKPKVLLLDEPTNALDRDARTRLIEVLLGLPQAMIIVSHDEDFVSRIATRQVVLDNGQFMPSTELNRG